MINDPTRIHVSEKIVPGRTTLSRVPRQKVHRTVESTDAFLLLTGCQTKIKERSGLIRIDPDRKSVTPERTENFPSRGPLNPMFLIGGPGFGEGSGRIQRYPPDGTHCFSSAATLFKNRHTRFGPNPERF